MTRQLNRLNPATSAVLALVVFFSWTKLAMAEMAPDKAAHAEASFVYGVVSSTVVGNHFGAFALALAPGLAKEILDSHQPGNRFSWGDLAADAVGAGLGIWVGNTVIQPTRNGIAFRYRFR